MRHLKPSLITCFFLLILFSVQTISQPSTVVPVKNPGIYISEVGSNSHFTLDPASSSTGLEDSFGQSIMARIYEGLLTFDGNSLQLYSSSLAYINYTVSSNGLNYTFYLKSGITFSNGAPFNAYVMQYSIQRAILINDKFSSTYQAETSIRSGTDYFLLNDANVTQANIFLANMSIVAKSDTILSIAIAFPTTGFVSSLAIQSMSAVSPKDIIANEPSSYTTNQSDNTFGMVSLTNMFPQLTANQIIEKLDLPLGSNANNSGIVPNSYGYSDAAYPWDPIKEPGTGAYSLTSDIVNTETDLQKNVNWWNNASFDANSPNKVEIKVVSSSSSRMLDLTSGNVDEIGLPANQLYQLINTQTFIPNYNNINFYRYPSLVENFLVFNQDPNLNATQLAQTNSATGYNANYIKTNQLVRYTWLNSTNGVQYASPGNPFTSLLFRKAFAYAFNYAQYISNITDNINSRAQGVIPNGLIGHQYDLITGGYIPDQNLKLARQLFQKVDWQGSITFSYNSPEAQATGNLLKSTIESLSIGITINVANMYACSPNCPDYLTLVNQTPMYFLNLQDEYPISIAYVLVILDSNMTIPNYFNPYVDELLFNAITTWNKTNISTFRELEINASQDYPLIYLDQENNYLLTSKWVTGISNLSSSLNPLGYGVAYQNIGLQSFTISQNTQTASGLSFATSSSVFLSNPNVISPGLLVIGIFLGIFVIAAIFYIHSNNKRRKYGEKASKKNTIIETTESSYSKKQALKLCPECSHPIGSNSIFCENCGNKII